MSSISVVIPAHNAQDYLSPCLKALMKAGFATREIIVIDDGSTDCTAQIAQDTGVRVIQNQTKTGAASARNLGAVACDSAIIFFVDADVTVQSDTKEVVLAFFEDQPDFAAVFGTYDDNPSSPEPVSRARNLLHRYVHLENAGEIASFWTGCGAVRRAAFLSVGGFDETLDMMEDINLGVRLAEVGHRIMLSPALQGTHLKRWTLSGMAKTDFFDRALPWARMLRNVGNEKSDLLNISSRSRSSVICVALTCLGLLVSPVFPVTGLTVALGALVAMTSLNSGYLRMIQKLDGYRALPAALLVLFVYYFCGGVGFALVRLRLDMAKC